MTIFYYTANNKSAGPEVITGLVHEYLQNPVSMKYFIYQFL